ncbi:PLP-dependent transferase [Ktedonosporobacter rubrisoli]|uniref:homocysteine desulfhydrase n=1 Tax=Ktedonosporobacter rubrisoli TaxID=2509675 RepID=A0A4P6K3P3_KTERU|nr:PLP-dependent aspartate aminotransferase family protein [Ktedonosporobacter rubrisoli]QBD82400.1 PLP-dependent transferase [Ktedonosporobacter rubrisoli]
MTERDHASSPLHIDTQLVHGSRHHGATASVGTPTVPPIYASTTYLHSSTEALDQAFNGTTPEGEAAFVYARQGNLSANAFEEALNRVEGGIGTISFSSGMAAIHAALMAAGLAPGAKIVASQDLYGASISLLQKVFIPIGVQVILRDLCTPDAADFIREEEPDVIFIETISNPLTRIIDLDAISAAAREVEAITLVDSTFTTPYLLRPIEHGIDLVIHSTTKYISGHGDSTGGAVTSAKRVLLDQLRNYANLLGAMLSPFDAHLMTRGLRTLALRMERHCSNALQVAHFLAQHPAVTRVYYPGLPQHPQHALANKLLGDGRYGGLLSFDLKEQSRQAVYCFMDSLQLCLPATTLGDVFSLVTYPPVSSHRTLTEQERRNLGISEGCIRLSVGIENIEDIINDLDQALRQ